MSTVQISHLSKSYHENDLALKELSLEIKSGEMVALLGPSGSGKSTLIRHINGLVCADKNTLSRVVVQGNPVQSNGKLDSNIRTRRANIGMIFQQFNLIDRLSVMTNVLIGGLSQISSYRTLLGIFTKQEKLAALAALELVGLKEFALKRASELSGGQQQRVAVARALMQKASIILADEPISSLDPTSARLVMDTLKKINQEQGITVIVTLHQVAYAKEYCQRTVALKSGEIFFDGPTTQLSNEKLAELYRSPLLDTQTTTTNSQSDLQLNMA